MTRLDITRPTLKQLVIRDDVQPVQGRLVVQSRCWWMLVIVFSCPPSESHSRGLGSDHSRDSEANHSYAVHVAYQTPEATQQKPDRVVIQNRSNGRSRTTLTGRVESFSGGFLKLRLLNRDVVKIIPESAIYNVETPLVESHIRGLKSFQSDDMDSAIQLLRGALNDETRSWVHQDIHALLIQCESRAGNQAAAMREFAKLIRLDPKTRHFHLVPLVWANRITNGREQSVGRSFVTDSEPVMRLIAASVMISDEKNRPFGEAELQSLTTTGDSRITHLARTQLWRLRLREGEIRPGELTGWKSRIRTMPDRLRAGPYYLLGRAHLGRHEYDKASIAFLRIPLAYDDDHRLAARACLEAAEALSTAGRKVESETLYREVATRYSDTPDAAVSTLR